MTLKRLGSEPRSITSGLGSSFTNICQVFIFTEVGSSLNSNAKSYAYCPVPSSNEWSLSPCSGLGSSSGNNSQAIRLMLIQRFPLQELAYCLWSLGPGRLVMVSILDTLLASKSKAYILFFLLPLNWKLCLCSLELRMHPMWTDSFLFRPVIPILSC